MNNLLKQAQKMQDDMAALTAELEQREYSGSAGGGLVSVTVSGKKKVLSVSIKPDAIDTDDIEMLEDLVTAACNDAIERAENEAAAEMQKLQSQFSIPGMPSPF